MTLTAQKERKLVEDVQTLTGERESKLGRALRMADLHAVTTTGASLRGTTGILSTNLDALSVRVTNVEGIIAGHTAQIAAAVARIAALEAADLAFDIRLDADEAELADHESRIVVLEAGTTAFTDLTDVPHAYTGEAGKVVRVNVGETGLEFHTLAPGPATTDTLTEGVTNLYFTPARVRATLLTGVVFTSSAAIVAGDTVLAALGQLQAQVTLRATTTYVDAADALLAPKNSPALTGVPTVPTAAPGTNTTQAANTAFVAAAAALLATLLSPIFTGTPQAPTAGAGTNTTQLATTAFVTAAVNAIIAAADAMVFKGVIDCSANPNYPAADAGWTYKVSVAGKIGGAAGRVVEAGDTLLCQDDGTAGGTEAAVGSHWNISQTNIDGAVTGPVSAVDATPAVFDGVSGKLIKNITYAAFKAALAIDTSDVAGLTAFVFTNAVTRGKLIARTQGLGVY